MSSSSTINFISIIFSSIFTVGISLVVKTSQDVIIDNIIFVETLVTIVPTIEPLCSFLCERATEGRANLRTYNKFTKKCTCFFASEEFRDSRKVAPVVEVVAFFANPELFEKERTLSVCDVKVSPEHSLQIATLQYHGFSKDDCLVRGAERNESDFSLAYCPLAGTCGLDLKPENTTTLSVTSNKTCSVFIQNVTFCASLDERLVQSDINECEGVENICGPRAGVCVNLVNQGYDCYCFPGYEKQIDWGNGTASCYETNECNFEEDVCPGAFDFCLNSPGSFECPCESAGFARETETSDCADFDECQGNQDPCPGLQDHCQNEIGSYTCLCESGFERIGNALDCTDINECNDENACPGPHDLCQNDIGSFKCPCESSAFERLTESSDCTDVDECSADSNTCTGQFELCVNKIGGFSCQCESTGFKRITPTSECADIDECQTQENPCPGPFDICANDVGSFTCPCESSGYERLSQSADCSDVDECIASSTCPDANEVCQNTQGSYTCKCKTGFERSDSLDCFDIDECASSNDSCPGPFDFCQNNMGSFECPCESQGYQRESESADCSDINECELPEACARCENSVGSYICGCDPGFETLSGSSQCTDIDECTLMEDPCPGPFDSCQNEEGTFSCPCQSAGYERLSESTNCSDIDECNVMNQCGGSNEVCENTEGSYSCVCDTGFERTTEGGASCSDIDECNSIAEPCVGPFERCENAVGTFTCPCESNGFSRQSSEANCEDIDECLNNCNSALETCANTAGTFVCSCNDGYERVQSTNLCQDVDECSSGVHNCDASANSYCINTVGSFDCGFLLTLSAVTSSLEYYEYGDFEYSIDGDFTVTSWKCFASWTRTLLLVYEMPFSRVDKVAIITTQFRPDLVVKVCTDRDRVNTCQLCGQTPSTSDPTSPRWMNVTCSPPLEGTVIEVKKTTASYNYYYICEVAVHGEVLMR